MEIQKPAGLLAIPLPDVAPLECHLGRALFLCQNTYPSWLSRRDPQAIRVTAYSDSRPLKAS